MKIWEKLVKTVKAEWGYKYFFNSYATNSKGVAILFLNASGVVV